MMCCVFSLCIASLVNLDNILVVVRGARVAEDRFLDVHSEYAVECHAHKGIWRKSRRASKLTNLVRKVLTSNAYRRDVRIVYEITVGFFRRPQKSGDETSFAQLHSIVEQKSHGVEQRLLHAVV